MQKLENNSGYKKICFHFNEVQAQKILIHTQTTASKKLRFFRMYPDKFEE